MSKNFGDVSGQDWQEVKIGKKKSIDQMVREGTLKKEIVEKQGAAKNSQITTGADISARKMEEEEIGHHQTPSHNLSLQIQQARSSKKMTQTQLDALCNFPKGTVSSYERGTAIINSNHLQTMSRHLGVILKKKT